MMPDRLPDPVAMTDQELVWLRDLIKSGNVHPFYVWGKWATERAHVLKQDKNECQHCKSKGRYKRAALVHHVKHLRDAPHLALAMWRQNDMGVWVRQLESLCDDCHADEHPERLRQYKKRAGFVNAERWD